MARRTSIQTPQNARLSVADMQTAIPRLNKRIDELEAFEPGVVTDPSTETRGLEVSIDEALVRTFGNDTVDYQRYSPAASFYWPINAFEETPIWEIRESLKREKEKSLTLLRQAVRALEERLEEAGASPGASSAPGRPTISADNNKVFIVHGHDSGPKEAVARLLTSLGFEPIILHEQANKGRTIIEKFEANADVGFAVVILTPDDVGGLKDGPQENRARQNVILELGYFTGRLSRERVCALKVGNVEIPSDILGVVWTDFDTAGAWRASLGKELKAAGYGIDWNVVMG